MKKVLVFVCKLAVSGILALVLLSAFAMIYYNPPVAEAQPDKYTNSKFGPNAFWSFMTEGFGFGVTNDLGYNDGEDFDPSKPVVAVIGSSHTEALEVPQANTYVSRLQDKLFEDADSENNIECLNLGISGHFFNISASNFPYFAESFQNVEYAIIETGNLEFSPEQLEKMLNGEYHSDLGQRGTLYTLAQKLPYVRLLYKQYQDTRPAKSSAAAGKEELDYEAYEKGLNLVLQKLSGIAEEKGFPLAILYHDAITVEKGQGSRRDDPKLLEIFRNCCEKNGIGFIDVTDRFVEHFNSTYELPYGFANTTMGSGHLNTLGHSIIADVLYEHITEAREGN